MIDQAQRRSYAAVYAANDPAVLRFKCRGCSRRFPSERARQMHTWQAHPTSAHRATATATAKAAAAPDPKLLGLEVPNANPDGSYTHCGRQFKHLWALKTHVRKAHGAVILPGLAHPANHGRSRIGRPPGTTKAALIRRQQELTAPPPPQQPTGNGNANAHGFPFPLPQGLPAGFSAEAMFSGVRMVSEGHHTSLEMVRMAIRVKLDTYTEVAHLIDSVSAPQHQR